MVGTLAMVEDTSPTALLATTKDTDAPPPYADDADLKETAVKLEEEQLLLVQTKPITSSNRGTVKHLQKEAGWTAPYRGLGVALVHSLLSHGIYSFISGILGGSNLSAALGFIVAQMLLFRLNMFWTHVVIARPMSKVQLFKTLYRDRRAKKALLPTFHWAFVHVAISYVLVTMTSVMGLDQVHNAHQDHKMACNVAAKGLLVFVTGVALVLFVYLPANVALTRCQASLLAEEIESIVPLDRSFGGNVDTHAPRLRLKDAWRTFDWNARVRLLKVYAKTIGLMMMSGILFTISALMFTYSWILSEQEE